MVHQGVARKHRFLFGDREHGRIVGEHELDRRDVLALADQHRDENSGPGRGIDTPDRQIDLGQAGLQSWARPAFRSERMQNRIGFICLPQIRRSSQSLGQ